jgi:hypothetical protein
MSLNPPIASKSYATMLIEANPIVMNRIKVLRASSIWKCYLTKVCNLIAFLKAKKGLKYL